MTDKQTDSTGDRIIKAREEERRRIMGSRPTLETKIGFTSHTLGAPLPTFTITIIGGDPDAVAKLGTRLADEALNELAGLSRPEDQA